MHSYRVARGFVIEWRQAAATAQPSQPSVGTMGRHARWALRLRSARVWYSGGSGALALTISAQPVSLTVDEGGLATFSVAATGPGPLAYQWLRNGEEIDGEESSSYTLAPALLTDSGAVFSVEVTDALNNTVTSNGATLTVNLVGGTLIVEDGTAKVDSDSYCSITTANTYHAYRGATAWAALTNPKKEAALRLSTDYMLQVYRWRWAGERKTPEQALDWPRYQVPLQDVSGGGYLADNVVPVAVQRACADLALRAASGDLAPDVGRVVASEVIDVIRIEYSAGAAPWVRYRAVDNMLTAYFKPSSGSSIMLSRS